MTVEDKPVGSASTATSDASAELQHDYAGQPVPMDRRRGAYSLAAVWVGWAISLSSLLVGGTVGAGTRFGAGLTAIIVGNVILAVIGTLIGYVGYRTGMTTYLASRLMFGTKGSVVPSLLLGILAMGFIGVLMDAFGSAMTALLPSVPWAVFVIGFAVAITATAIYGFKGLAVLSVVAAPLMVVFAVLSIARIGAMDGGLSAAVNAEPTAPIGFSTALTVVIATWITGAALSSDIARYARRPIHIVIGAIAGYVIGAGSFEATAMLSASAVGNPNFITVMSGLGLLIPAAVIITLTLWTTTDNNLYSASLAFVNASSIAGWIRDKRVWVLVSVAIAVVTAFGGFAANFAAFLNIIATVTPPFAGLFLAHFYVLGNLRKQIDHDLEALPAVRWAPLVAWAATSVTLYFVDVPLKPLVGLLAGGVVYGALAALVGAKDRAGATAAVGEG